MRILHLAKYYWPRSGGMERVVQGLAEGAAGLGHQVEVVAVEGRGKAGSADAQRSSVTRAFSFAALGSQEIAPGYIAAAWKRADIIHVHHPAPARRPGLPAPRRANAGRGDPARGLASVDISSRDGVGPAPRGGGGGPEPRPSGALDRAGGLGEQGRGDSVRDRPDAVGTVPPPPPGAAPRAIFIGRLVAYKGLDILLRALERVPELRLDVVGSGPEGPRLRTLAQALAITDRVRWYGEYPDEDLPRRMADADFLVLPSVTVEEMFGLVVLEAMAAGRPVITTALPSAVREVNVPGVTGLEVPLRDVPALAQALEALSHDPVRRRTLGEAGRRRVAERFTQAAMAERHIELYERIRATKH